MNQSDFWNIVIYGALGVLLLAVVGLWSLDRGRSQNLALEWVEVGAGPEDIASIPGFRTKPTMPDLRYRQIELGRMVAHQRSSAADIYWAVNFNVWLAEPISPDGPEAAELRGAARDVLAAVLDLQEGSMMPASIDQVRLQVAEKLPKRCPNVRNVTVLEAHRSEVGRM